MLNWLEVIPLWAKKYLMEIQKLEEQINQRLEELSSLKAMYGLKGCGLSEKVQTSKKGDSLENEVIKCVELEKEIKDLIDKFSAKKHKIIGQIHELKDLRYINVLHMRYTRYMSFESIAVELNYSYDYVRVIHKKALKNFESAHKITD